jgi:hypothetical protein
MVALHPNMLTNIAPQKERGGGVPYHRMCRGWGGSEGDRVTWRRHPHPRRTQVYLPAPSLLLRSVIPLGIIAVCWGCKVLILASTAATITPPFLALAHSCQRPAPAPPQPPHSYHHGWNHLNVVQPSCRLELVILHTCGVREVIMNTSYFRISNQNACAVYVYSVSAGRLTVRFNRGCKPCSLHTL